jgi:hypothetical protein
MIRPQGSDSTRKRAVSPSLAQSAAWPAPLRSAMIPRESAGSSSTSRIRAVDVLPYIQSARPEFRILLDEAQASSATESHHRALPFVLATFYHAARIRLSDNLIRNDEITLEIKKRHTFAIISRG